MVSISSIRSSNSLVSTTLPPGLVALFVGATSGIGEATLKQFAQHATQPRVYFVGRSQEAADRITAECQALNPGGQYVFRKADVSLIKVVDEVCEEIKAREQAINLLFLSCGVPSMDRSKTAEGVHLLAALNYYARVRFTTNLLPLVRRATALRRVVTVGGGGHESGLDAADFPALQVPQDKLRGHLTSLVTLGLEAVARTAPDVSFVHDYPGTVRTKLLAYLPEEALRTLEFMPLEESGQRQLYVATSSRFPPASGVEAAGVPLGDGVEIAVGTSGVTASGVYSVGSDCESASPAVLELLSAMRAHGLVRRVHQHTDDEFRRVTNIGKVPSTT
ncbi:putative short-chain dehydrogenase reductase SDR [Rosellinia necatrix]|uniref:Putative short-chain dehydrogenase reductase SDR n=1 Tax=Rosellinia necatrix TaxID=77044 RepID=A0A1S7UHX3_ROSNE|nr:putative short-chain dehydrogenase reductase SDR [Rosellinia necatrix]